MAFAHLLTAAEVVMVAISLGYPGRNEADTPLSAGDLVAIVLLIVLGTVTVAAAGAWSMAPSLRWYSAGSPPDARQRRAAINLVRKQSVILLLAWVISGLVMLIVRHGGVGLAGVIGLTVLFGGTATVNTSFLLTRRTLRPVVAAATLDYTVRETAPGVLARLVTMWVLTSALPCTAIVVLIVLRWNGWIIESTTTVELPVVVLSLVAVLLGLPVMIVVARSISDPVGDVVDAMAEVQHGRLDRVVDVYEQSEIGRLQSGFNRMVAGLKERDRLHDLFGRHVGAAVARQAVEADETPPGDVREVGVLFIDLVGSTALAAGHPPDEVAAVLNDFFRIVVAAVDARGGLINKFQGDAVLAVFGAPITMDQPASAALATSRALREQLRRLPVVDFGVGVSAGRVFAGNIGAENRYEYTVIGDAVNEAARLADRAKGTGRRILCSAAALARADTDEQRRWVSCDAAVLRGRAEPTHMSAPAD